MVMKDNVVLLEEEDELKIDRAIKNMAAKILEIAHMYQITGTKGWSEKQAFSFIVDLLLSQARRRMNKGVNHENNQAQHG
jgi:hypothetical protein